MPAEIVRSTIPPPIPTGFEEAGNLPVWTFLWGGGFRQLRLARAAARSTPFDDDVVVSSLSELLDCFTTEDSRKEFSPALRHLLVEGLLEQWTSHARFGTDLSATTRDIRSDTRDRKLERWLHQAGSRSYSVGGRSVQTIGDFARLPLDVDPALVLEEIRAGVPQGYFRDPKSIAIFEETLVAAHIPDGAKALVACFRLGLEELPIQREGAPPAILREIAELEPLLERQEGSRSIFEHIESGVLEAWLSRLNPSAERIVASIREARLTEQIAVDRLARLLFRGALFWSSKHRVTRFDELRALASDPSEKCCRLPNRRNRIREALLGPTPLEGTPDDVLNTSEQELSKPELQSIQPEAFAWTMLGVRRIPIGDRVIESLDELLEAISDPDLRSAAEALAMTGTLSLWLSRALGLEVPESASASVSPGTEFSNLMRSFGEPAPDVEISWSEPTNGRAVFRQGAAMALTLHLENRDRLRTAEVILSAIETNGNVAIGMPKGVVLQPGNDISIPITLNAPTLFKGRFELQIDAEHRNGASLPTLQEINVVIGFPWWSVLGSTLTWGAVAGFTLLFVRFVIDPVLANLAYRTEPLSSGREVYYTLFALALGLLCVGVEHVVLWRRRSSYWLHERDDRALRLAAAMAVVALIVTAVAWTWREPSPWAVVWMPLLIVMIVCALAVPLARRDLIGATFALGSIALAPLLGRLLVAGSVGLDAFALRNYGTEPTWAWMRLGLFIGGAMGCAIGFRRVGRPIEGEVARAVWLSGVLAFL